MTVIGDAYVEVKAKTDGFESGAESMFSGFGAKAAVAFAAGFAAVGAVGKVLYDIGAGFDEGFDKIRVGTGATGMALEGLKASTRNVFANVPEDIGTVSGALATLNQKLGLTGKPLEDLTKQVLDLSHITGTDATANIKGITDVFLNFGVAAGDQGAKLDELFRATQQSGLGITDLTSQLGGAGVQLRALGLDFDDSTALIAGLAKNGLAASDVMPSLSKAMAVAAKSGKDAGTVFRETVDAIKSAPDATKASGIALDVFGARAGPRMAQLIREGKLSFDDLKASILGGSDTIAAATKDTQDFSEKLDIFKNRVLLKLEPIAMRVFDALGDGMDRLAEFWRENGPAITVAVQDFGAQLGAALQVVIPPLQELVGWLVDHKDQVLAFAGVMVAISAPLLAVGAAAVYAYTQFDGFRSAVDAVVSWLRDVAAPAVADFSSHIIDSFGDAVAWVQTMWPQISEAIGHVMRVVREVVGAGLDFISAIWRAVHDDIWHIVQAVWANIRGQVEAAIKIVQGVIKTVLALINGDWGKAWDGIKQVLAGVWDSIVTTVSTGIEGVKALFGGILSQISAVWSGIWDKLKALAKIGWQSMVDWFQGGGIGSLLTFFIGLPGQIFGAITNLVSRFYHLGLDIMNGMKNGVVEAAVALKDAVVDAVTAPWDWAVDFVEAHSPSKKWARLGAWTIQGYLDGMKSKSADVTAWVGAMLRNMVTAAQTATSSIRSAWAARDARETLRGAEAELWNAQSRANDLPALIAAQRAKVAAETAAATAVTPAEQIRIARAQQGVIDKTDALTKARTDGEHTALELRIMELELEQAQEDVTVAIRDSTGATDQLREAQDKLRELLDEQAAMTQRLADANRAVESATLGVVEAQASMTAQASALVAGGMTVVDMFVKMAEAAGLSEDSIRGLLDALGDSASPPTSLGGPPVGTTPGQRPRLINTVTGRPAFTGPNGEGGSAAPRGVAGETSWIMPDGTRAYYVPGQNIDAGNLGALNGGGGAAPGGGSSGGSSDGWDIAAGTGPNGIRFTPGGGGLTAAQLAAMFGGGTARPITVAQVNYSSIDTKGLLERMNVEAAVGAAVTKSTRLRPITP